MLLLIASRSMAWLRSGTVGKLSENFTSKVLHLEDNLAAAQGRLPDERQLSRMAGSLRDA